MFKKILDNVANLQVRDLLAIFLVNEFAIALFYCLSQAFPKQNEQLVTYMLGQLSGFVGTAIALYFSASRHDDERSKQTDQLTQALVDTSRAVVQGPSGNAGDPVHTVEEEKP